MNAVGARMPRPAAPRPMRADEEPLSAADGTPQLLAEVAVDQIASDQSTYTYAVPEHLAPSLAVGQLVEVPFGRRTLQGVLVSLHIGIPGPYRLRPVRTVARSETGLDSTHLHLAQWISTYYRCTLYDALALMLPPLGAKDTVVEYQALPEPESAIGRLSPRQAQVLRLVQRYGSVTAVQAADGADLEETTRVLEGLARRKLLARAVTQSRNPVAARLEYEVVLQPQAAQARLGRKQQEIVNCLASLGGRALVSALREHLAVDAATLTRLQQREVVALQPHAVRRDPLAHRHLVPQPVPSLTGEQELAVAALRTAIRSGEPSTFLLHGVTGSGKTEVYLRAVAAAVALGKQAVVLVPEIGLTPQTIERFAGRFPGRVALLHSKLSQGERLDEWERMRTGACDIVIGARSALFSPFPHPGLIILDEEHDASYKQDRSPRYHAREVAIRLAELCGATVVLGSATPDVCTYARADTGAFRLLTMRSRVPRTQGAGSAAQAADGLPPVRIVDMRQELKVGNRSIFSRALQRALQQVMARGEQAILFLNRRGHATFVNCRDCGHVLRCPQCDIPYAYHRAGEHLLCHRCGARAVAPSLCPVCGSWRIRYFGLGTQRVEQELQERFPSLRVQRYDRDVISGKLAHEEILTRFARREADVLVGTQVVTKGLDFPSVTLVGVIAADSALNLPDYRAAERTFQVLTQVAGRAGRAALPGTVVVQTYNPGHFAIQTAAQHDYLAFYHDELRFRREACYPPFAQLARLTYSSVIEDQARLEAERLAGELRDWTEAHHSAGIEILGPAPCFIAKASGAYFWQLIVRGGEVHEILADVPRGWSIDVDPVSLL